LKFEETETVTFGKDGFLLLEQPLVQRRRSASSEDDYTIKCITKGSPPFANNYKALQRVSISYRHCLAEGGGVALGPLLGHLQDNNVCTTATRYRGRLGPLHTTLMAAASPFCITQHYRHFNEFTELHCLTLL
jgi:hypothetical protein